MVNAGESLLDLFIKAMEWLGSVKDEGARVMMVAEL